MFMHDGVTYEISATKRDGNFGATWVCQKCGEAGTSSRGAETEADALLAAQLLVIEGNHSKRHATRR
jgi:hypothetical protein